MCRCFFQLVFSLILIVAGLIQQQTPVRAESQDDLLVIANRNLPVSNMSLADVKRIFLKEITSYEGSRVQPIHARKGTALREQFIRRVLGMNESAEQKYWQDIQVKKGLRPPIELGNTVRAVFSAPGAISYCYRKDYNPATARIVFSL